MTHRKISSKPNGHAGPHGRANGHAPASTERGGVPMRRDQAASDDDSRASVTAVVGFGTAPGTGCHSCAEAAPPHSGKKNGKINKKDKNGKMNKKDKNGKNRKYGQSETLKNFLLAGPTDFAAMQDGAAYVNSVAGRVDLVGASVRLVGSEDEKIAKAELDRLRDMKFGKVGPAANASDGPTVVWDERGVNVSRNEG